MSGMEDTRVNVQCLKGVDGLVWGEDIVQLHDLVSNKAPCSPNDLLGCVGLERT